jgi:hypothetical protein
MANVRTKLTQQDRPRFRAAFADPDLGDLVFNLLSVQTGGVDVPVTFNGLTASGAPAGSNIVARELVSGNRHFTRLTLDSRSVTMTDEAGVIAYGGTKLYDFPAGVIRLHGFTINLSVVGSGAGIEEAWDGDYAVGTATASNNATLTSTEANIIPSTALTQATVKTTTIARSAMNTIVALTDSSGGTASDTIPAQTGAYVEATQETTVASLAGKINEVIAANVGSFSKNFDGTSTAIDLYLNFLIDDDDQDGGGALLLTGTVDFEWSWLGDV